MRFITLTNRTGGRNDVHVNVETIMTVGRASGETRIVLTNGGIFEVAESVDQVLALINDTDTVTNNHATPLRGLTELHLDDLAARVNVEVTWIGSQHVIGSSSRDGWKRSHDSLVSVVRELRGEA